MGLIKESLDVNFIVDPRPLTKEEQRVISEFIRADKEKRRRETQRTKPGGKRKLNQLK